MAHGKFGTAINCMDGRAQLPVIAWLKANYHLDYVDMITEPGPDKAVAQGAPELLAALRAKALVSVRAHGSVLIAIVGHDDCAGNPVPKEEHWRQIRQATQVIRSWDLPAKVIGLWLDDTWNVQTVDG
jgi:hypothetical protein